MCIFIHRSVVTFCLYLSLAKVMSTLVIGVTASGMDGESTFGLTVVFMKAWYEVILILFY